MNGSSVRKDVMLRSHSLSCRLLWTLGLWFTAAPQVYAQAFLTLSYLGPDLPVTDGMDSTEL